MVGVKWPSWPVFGLVRRVASEEKQPAVYSVPSARDTDDNYIVFNERQYKSYLCLLLPTVSLVTMPVTNIDIRLVRSSSV